MRLLKAEGYHARPFDCEVGSQFNRLRKEGTGLAKFDESKYK
jgi:hypothetical protein